MRGRPTVTVPAVIGEAQLRFENWRSKRKRCERIPENLWVTVVELAKQHGVWPTARALRLDYNRLKPRLRNDGEDVKSGAFIELIAQGAMPCSCSVEMEDGRGARMRIELKGAAADVTALSRAFSSERELCVCAVTAPDLGRARACRFPLRDRWPGESVPDHPEVGSVFGSVIRFSEPEIEIDQDPQLQRPWIEFT